ncbi:LysM domain-containing protein [Candidatus Ornithobacterium hominis]|uniref:hypothetical protein n=1 Tax=Candidatus Ornithobacterium hominis TaxID=2497989 RepID=UPI0024BC1F4C|nr:hypothetical protein [Candidatus Ornithobacterium hominis]CAI9429694.1 LysM domain-containing protein [Candidatus Ornithobacterium hominis]
MQITTLHNQSLLDLALQHTGSVENAFDIAVANGISLTDDLAIGSRLNIPNDLTKNNDIYNYYTAKNIQPATAIQVITAGDNGTEEIQEGISAWAINHDFKVAS